MKVDLTPEQEKIAMGLVGIGAYDTVQDVIDDALDRLFEDRTIATYDKEELKASLRRGRAEFTSGGGLSLRNDAELAEYFDDVIGRGKARLAARAKAAQG